MKRKAIPKKIREEVYNKYNGHCAYCGCELEYKDMQVDHFSSVLKAEFNKDLREDLDTIENYMPACRKCNFYKGAGGIETMRKNISRLYIQLERQFDYKLAKKYNLIQETPHEIKFYFEKLEHQNKYNPEIALQFIDRELDDEI